MKTRFVAGAVVLALLATALPGSGAPVPKEKAKEKKGTADPPGIPLELRILAKKTSYVLDRGGKTPADFLKQFEDGKERGIYPPAPVVDLTVELRNTGKTDIKVQVKGDSCALDLTLKGKGALNVKPRAFFTTVYIRSHPLTLAPGKTVTFPVKSLDSGFRGGSRRAFWTEPGTYELIASYHTGVFPHPKGAKNAGSGWGSATITSAPLELRVTAK
jgi:hypothetical protein